MMFVLFLDMVLKVVDAFKQSEGVIGNICKKFQADHDLEQFETYEDMYEFWSRKENLHRLSSNQFGKLNAYYAYEILENISLFVEILRDQVTQLIDSLDLEDKELTLKKSENIN